MCCGLREPLGFEKAAAEDVESLAAPLTELADKLDALKKPLESEACLTVYDVKQPLAIERRQS